MQKVAHSHQWPSFGLEKKRDTDARHHVDGPEDMAPSGGSPEETAGRMCRVPRRQVQPQKTGSGYQGRGWGNREYGASFRGGGVFCSYMEVMAAQL